MSSRLQALLDEASTAGVFPQARAVVLLRGQPVFDAGAGGAGSDTVFDLASVTKVMSSTALFLRLWGEGRLSPDTAVSRYFPDSPAGKAGVTLGDLLSHRSGLPAFAPFFAAALRAFPRLLDEGCPSLLREQARAEVLRQALATPLERPPRSAAVYSDIGFVILGEALAAEAGAPLDEAFHSRVAGPLGLHGARFHRLSARRSGDERAAPTGRTRPREPAPGQEGLWEPSPPHPSPPGEVDDDNAWVMDGVAGHAGLFGTAGTVAAYGQAVLEELRGAGLLAPAALWQLAARKDLKTPGSTRALGFDTPSPGGACGRHLGGIPPGAVGHLGFTGISLWLDLPRQLVVALCTNRTYNGRAEVRIRDFRPRFHDAVLEELKLAP
ncbi:MAG: serine hydrolase domain-containing protein [Myxococcaceae bacterium]